MENVADLERSFEEVSIKSKETRNEKDCDREGGSKMFTTQNKKRRRVSFHRPSPYPLAKGLSMF